MTTTEKMALALTLVKEYAPENKPDNEIEAITWSEAGIDKILAAYNELKGTDAPAKELGEVYHRIEALRDIYNQAACEKHMKDVKQQHDGMMWVINNPHYRIIKIKHGKQADDFKEIKEKADRRVDLLKLKKFCGEKFGADATWAAKLHQAWLVFQARGVLDTVSEEVTPEEIKAAKVGGMSDDDAKKKVIGERFGKALKTFDQCDFVKRIDNMYQGGVSLMSNGRLEEFIVATVKAMIGDSEENKKYMPRLKDVRYILKVYTKRSRKDENTVEYVKEREFSDIIMDILRCRVCGIEYTDRVNVK